MVGHTGVLTLRARDRTLGLSGSPLLMGVVNATPDSFSDTGEGATVDERARHGLALIAQGADLIDVGGESGVTNRPPVEPAEEIERVVPLIQRLVNQGVTVSVDTYKPEVARAAIEAGAVMVNDVSGLRDPELADVCAASGAALVLMHTVGAPKQKVLDHDYSPDVVSEVIAFLAERIGVALERGVGFDSLLVDPGPDFGKTPAQTIELLRSLPRLAELGRPILLAVSRKDFVGALTERLPAERDPGTLAAIGVGVRAGAHVLRVHDVAGTRDFLAVDAALRGRAPVDRGLMLPEELRRQPRDG